MLDEGVSGDEVQECLVRHKVVVGAVGFALARWAGSVFLGLGGQHGILLSLVVELCENVGGEVIMGFLLLGRKEGRKEGREGCLVYIRETENPKVSGCWAKSRLRSVDLPAPEGPETTIKGFPAGAGAAAGYKWVSGPN